MKGMAKKQVRPRREKAAEQAEIQLLAPLVLDYMRNGMETDWKTIKAQRPFWPQGRCEEYYRKVRSHIIRNNIRSGI